MAPRAREFRVARRGGGAFPYALVFVLLLVGVVGGIVLAKEARRRVRGLARDPRRIAAACRDELANFLLDQEIDPPPSATVRELGLLAQRRFGADADRVRRRDDRRTLRRIPKLRLLPRASPGVSPVRFSRPVAASSRGENGCAASSPCARSSGSAGPLTSLLRWVARQRERVDLQPVSARPEASPVGMAAQATVALEKAKRREPDKASIREALGIAYFRIRRYEEAEAEFRTAARALARQRLRPLRARPLPRDAGEAGRGERPLQARELPQAGVEAVPVADPRPRVGRSLSRPSRR